MAEQTETTGGINRENIQRVRDVIAGLPPGRFDMHDYGPGPEHLLHDCGTSACIAGWTVAVLRPETDESGNEEDVAELFGLKLAEANALCLADGLGDLDQTIPQAVRVLDILLETGAVDWPRAIADSPASEPVGA